MKKAAAVGIALAFAVCMIHFYYAEDHCPVHCQTKAGHYGHVHDHHACASTCLCFWSSLFSPESGEMAGSLAFMPLSAAENEAAAPAPLGADIAHPPKVLSA